jgi:hypothetical protein
LATSSTSKLDNPAEATVKRQQAVDFARASVGSSGFKITGAHERRAQRFIDGEISLAKLLSGPDNSSK